MNSLEKGQLIDIPVRRNKLIFKAFYRLKNEKQIKLTSAAIVENKMFMKNS